MSMCKHNFSNPYPNQIKSGALSINFPYHHAAGYEQKKSISELTQLNLVVVPFTMQEN